MALSRAGTFLIGAVALCVSGCGDSHEAVTRNMLSAQKELCAILEGVKDEASAQAAVTQIEALAVKMQRIGMRSHALGNAPAEVRESLRAKYDPEFMTTAEAAREALSRIDPQLLPRLEESLGKIAVARIN